MTEQFRRLRRTDLADLLGIGERAVDKRIAKLQWAKEKDEDGLLWILVPESYLERKAAKPEPVQTVGPVHAGPVPSPAISHTGIEPGQFMQALESIRAEYSTRLEEKDDMIRLLKEQNQALNNQVQATNSAIQRYKSLDDQLREIRDAVKKPFWAFWKK